ncbi:hypothetical protein GCM10009628_23850 [Paeniglutamicibacter kerguelensis]
MVVPMMVAKATRRELARWAGVWVRVELMVRVLLGERAVHGGRMRLCAVSDSGDVIRDNAMRHPPVFQPT